MRFEDSLITTNLWDLADYTNGRATKPSELVKQGMPIIKIAELSRGITAQTNMVAKSAVDPKHIVCAGDLLFAWSGTIGIHTYDGPQAALNQHIFKVVAKDFIDQAFLRYLLEAQLKVLQGFVEEKKTTMGHVTIANLKTVEVSFPKDLAKQRHIASYLASLDHLLNLNNRRSKTLEVVAQTVFKSWFIDFDPVKKKIAGEEPAGMDTSTAALFPAAMQESEFGLTPKGWSWQTIGDIAQVIDCLHSKKPELLAVGSPYLQLDTISDSGVLHFEKAAFISTSDYEKWTSRIEVQGGDCVITNVGRVGAVSQIPDHFKAAIGRNITAIRPRDSKLHRSFLIVALLSDFMKKEIIRNTDSGTILEALNVKSIPKLRIPQPPAELLVEFAKLCDPIWLQIQELHAMNINLRSIRDSLLPRLISGDLQIPKVKFAS
jgi:type I restriction enzyme S subunit